jgi:hypothetical protein
VVRQNLPSPSPQTKTGVRSGADWQEWGFDNEPVIVEGQPESSLSRREVNQSERRVVAWMREIERGIELSFDPPT